MRKNTGTARINIITTIVILTVVIALAVVSSRFSMAGYEAAYYIGSLASVMWSGFVLSVSKILKGY